MISVGVHTAITGVIKRKVYPAGKRISGKSRGEWMKLTDEEAALINRMRAPKVRRESSDRDALRAVDQHDLAKEMKH